MGWYLFLVLVLVIFSCVDGQPLPALNIDINESAVCGFSSGGFFAVQMHIAYSSIFKGAGIFAGGPYDCAQGSLATALGPCMKDSSGGPDVTTSLSTTYERSYSGELDDTTSLIDQKVFMFSGTEDGTVSPPVMASLYEYYQALIDPMNIYFDNITVAAHTFPTTNPKLNICTASYSPYISYCDYDGAGRSLKQIYGNLNDRNNGTLSGKIVSFDQSIYLPNPSSKSIGSTGYVYIPNNCSTMGTCKLVVVFHGCLQDYDDIGLAYVEDAGFNEWADSNSLVVLYPQTTKSLSNPSNNNACWNWYGYNNNPTTYDTKSGYQMNMVYTMIQQLTSAFISLSAPTSLNATVISDSTVSLEWVGVQDADSYNVYRDAMRINVNPVREESYLDNSVDSGSFYTYTVTSMKGNVESAPSTPAVVKTTGTLPPLVAPSELIVTNVSSSSVSLSWSKVASAGYRVYRDGTQISPHPILRTFYIDDIVTSSTTYNYYVTSIRPNCESVPSPTISVTTSSSFVCSTYTSSNYNHVQQGRAYQTLGETYANGSNEDMGLYNTFQETTLSETNPNYYIIGQCPN